jgi:hypothetical protein
VAATALGAYNSSRSTRSFCLDDNDPRVRRTSCGCSRVCTHPSTGVDTDVGFGAICPGEDVT